MGPTIGVQKRGLWKVYRNEVKVEMSFEEVKGKWRMFLESKSWWQEVYLMFKEKSCLAGG